MSDTQTITVGSSLVPAQPSTTPQRRQRPVAFYKLFVPLDAAPGEGDLAEVPPTSVMASPQLTINEVADIIGYEPHLIRRANGAGPYFQDDLRRLYWRTRRLWHRDYDRCNGRFRTRGGA